MGILLRMQRTVFLTPHSLRQVGLILALVSSWLSISVPACAEYHFDTSKDSTALLTGYGQSVPGWGQTTERVQTIDLIPRYNHVVFDKIGSGWWQGFHSTLVELPVHLVVSPDTSTMIGINFLACYTFTASEKWRPYIFGGGGPVYSFADIHGMGAELNGNYQFAAGLEYKLNDEHALLFELRYHHISNAGTEEPNISLNSGKILLGMTF